MRREELRDVVIEECQARGAQSERICGEVQPSADNPGFQLGGAISTISQSLENGVQVGQEKHVGRGIARKVLLQAQIA